VIVKAIIVVVVREQGSRENSISETIWLRVTDSHLELPNSEHHHLIKVCLLVQNPLIYYFPYHMLLLAIVLRVIILKHSSWSIWIHLLLHKGLSLLLELA